MDWTDSLSRYIDRDIYRRAYVHYMLLHCAWAALRANVAGRIGNRFSQAESAGYLHNPILECFTYLRGRGHIFIIMHCIQLAVIYIHV